MSNDRWDALVQRFEAKAKADPRGYKRSVALWAGLGYLVLIGALALSIAAVVGIGFAVIAGATVILIKLAIPALALSLLFARALFVKLPPPEGIEVAPDDAPELFATIERLREKLGAPRLHQVLLDGDFNASIVQLPRIGPFGGQHNYLTIGLPLMGALSEDEFASVLAHELGHVSGQHGRFSAWIYRLRSSWVRVMEELDSGGHVAAGLIQRFFHWYVPRFTAHSFALARAHEYEADRAAADAVGKNETTRALARVAVAAAAEHEYWDELYRRVNDESAAPRTAYTALLEVLPARIGAVGLKPLQRRLEQPTDTADTHPSLGDRLLALECSPDELVAGVLAQPELTAAEAFLSNGTRERLAQRLDREWQDHVGGAWGERHVEAGEEDGRLGELEAAAKEAPLDLDAARERAGLTARLYGDEAAVTRWLEVLALDPEDPAGNLAVGEHLLSLENDTGLDHLERAAAADPALTAYAAEAAYAYLVARGRPREAARHRSTANSHSDLLVAADEERRSLTAKDALDPHNLSPDELDGLRAALTGIDELGAAYLVRKRVEHFADQAPLYVLGLVPDIKWWQIDIGAGHGELVESVLAGVKLPGETLVFPLAAENKWLRKRLQRESGALVFSR